MTDVAVVGFAHAPHVRRTEGTTNGVEMLMPCFAELYADLGIKQTDIGFWCSGSSDYLAGRAFSFISAIDSIGAVPPINESHVEMDAAWALYEAYIKILTGQVDTALVYGFGKSSAGIAAPGPGAADRPVHRRAAVAGRRVDGRPAGPASAWTPASGPPSRWPRWRWTRSPPPAAPTPRSRPRASTSCWPGRTSPIRCAATTSRRSPTARRRSCWPPATRPASCARTRRGSPVSSTASRRPVLGARDLTTSPSTAASAAAATGGDAGSIDVAELYAPFTHQQLILTEAIGLSGVDEDQPVGWRAGRQPDVLGRPGAHRLRRPAHLRRLRAAGAGARDQRRCAATESGRRHGRESN